MKIGRLFLLSVFIIALTQCNNGGDEPEPKDGGKVRYEATIDDPSNFKIQVNFMDNEGAPLKDTIVDTLEDGPFKLEFDADYGTYLYASVQPVARIEDFDGATTVSCKMYLDNSLLKQDSDDVFAVVEYVLGQD